MTRARTVDDPFAAHFQRDPLPDAGIRIILLTDLPPERAEAIIAPLADLIAALGRPVERSHRPGRRAQGFGAALEPRPRRGAACRWCW